ncbi:hypothetical protein B7463_g11197, partial [Scytalidium lignicola]
MGRHVPTVAWTKCNVRLGQVGDKSADSTCSARYGPISTLELVSQNEFLSTDGHNLGSQMIHQIGLVTKTASNTTSKNKNQLLSDVVTTNSNISTNKLASSDSSHNGKSSSSRLPSYFKPPPSFMILEDVEHLDAIGAFSTPPNGLRDALLQSFLDYVHPLNAVLDVQDLFAMEGLTGDSTVSLLVFYTVMLGGSLFVDMKHLTEAGYATRKAARQSFYNKSKAVYEADYEQDKLCIAQALSLLSLWWETPGGHKGCWYWSGLAINLLHLVFLDIRRDEARLGRKSMGKWRRLWWSCFVRDRIIGIGMKLPTRLSIADYEMEILELDDFDLEGVTLCQLSLKETTKLSWCPEKFRGLYTLCIEEIKLCICIDHLICIGRIEPLNPESKIQELQSCESELQNWRSQLPEVAALSLDLDLMSDSNSILIKHHTTLRMMSYCVYAFTQRAYLILNLPDSQPLKNTVLKMQNLSRVNINSTADVMTKIAEELQERGLIRYMPHSAVFSFILVALMYLLDLTAVNGIEGISRSPNTSSSTSTPEGHDVNYSSPPYEWEIGQPAEISNPPNLETLGPRANDTLLIQAPQSSLQEASNGSLDVEGLKILDTSTASNEADTDVLLMSWLNNEWPMIGLELEALPEDIEMILPKSQS